MEDIKGQQRYLCKKVIMLAEQLEHWQRINEIDKRKYAEEPSDMNRIMLEVSEKQIKINAKWKAQAIDALAAHKEKYGDLMQ